MRSAFPHSPKERFCVSMQCFSTCSRYPFDWHTPAGFLLCAGSQASTVFARGQIIICSLSLVAGFSLFMSEFVSDLEQILRNINEDLCTPNNEHLSRHIRNQFHSFIQFDSQAKQLSRKCSFVLNKIHNLINFFLDS